MSLKRERLEERIRELVARFAVEELPPHLGVVSVTGVRLSGDGRTARVFFTVLPEEKAEEVKAFFEEHRRTLRERIARLKVRTVPRLEFELHREPPLGHGAL